MLSILSSTIYIYFLSTFMCNGLTQHLDGKSGSIFDFCFPGIVEDPIILKHQFIVIVHPGSYFQICPSKTMRGISNASDKLFWNARYFE